MPFAAELYTATPPGGDRNRAKMISAQFGHVAEEQEKQGRDAGPLGPPRAEKTQADLADRGGGLIGGRR